MMCHFSAALDLVGTDFYYALPAAAGVDLPVHIHQAAGGSSGGARVKALCGARLDKAAGGVLSKLCWRGAPCEECIKALVVTDVVIDIS